MSAKRRILRGHCAFAILMLMADGAQASTSVLGYGGAGNELTPGGQPMSLPRDENGLSQLDDVTRTPTGLLYPLPYAYPVMTQSKDDPDWWTRGWVEGGLSGSFGANPGSATFNRYGDWRPGPFIATAGYLAENRKTAQFFSALIENAG